MAKVITYKCSQCGATVVVTKDLDTQLSPIYCCGEEASIVSEKEVSAQELINKTVALAAKKKTIKKKPAAKKTIKKKSRSKKTKR
jgi:DNA-directed RNA polymerase subunit RPC12/RpoP